MVIGNEMHQQFIKDFIQSLGGSEDSNSRMQSRSMSESSLNPNAAEFVPSYLKSSDGDDEDYEPPHKRKEEKPLASSTTTLVDNETVGDALPMTKEDQQGRVQRQLFNLLTLLGNQSLPLAEIKFCLASNGQGINVQFLASESVKKQALDKQLCQAAGLHLKIDDCALLSSRPGNSLAAQFLSRMSNVLSDKAQNQLPSICPKCTALPKKRSFTELEIDRQIEDIKAFEELINEDAGVRYQEAFKELCHKLGLATNGEQSPESNCALAAQITVSEVHAEVDDGEFLFIEDEDQSNYDWDTFTPEFTPTKIYRYSAPSASEMHVNELVEQHYQRQEQQLTLKDEYDIVVPPSTPTISTTTANAPSIYPKLYKVNQVKWSSATGLRKPNNHKEKESKIQRWRYTSPAAAAAAAAASAAASASAVASAAASAAASTTASTTPSTTAASPAAAASASVAAAAGTGTATASTAVAATPTVTAYGTAFKKAPERSQLNGNHINRPRQRTFQSKSGNVGHMPDAIAKPGHNYKLESRQQLVLPKQQIDQVQVNKVNKTPSLSRPAGLGQPQGPKHSPAGAQRVVAPRSTHASQMRQSEVKRRLNLMRGENDTDVQLNEYLFK